MLLSVKKSVSLFSGRRSWMVALLLAVTLTVQLAQATTAAPQARWLAVTGTISVIALAAGLLFSYLAGRRKGRGESDSLTAIAEGLSARDLSRLTTGFRESGGGETTRRLMEGLEELRGLIVSVRTSTLESENAGRKLASQVGDTLASIARIASRSAATDEEVRLLQEKVVQGASAMEEILAAIESLVSRISRQNGVVEESASAVEQMSASIESVAKVAESKRGASQELATLTVTGSAKVQQTEAVIEEVSREVGSVRQMITVINEVAARTNMLAMNAAIEAAHAGQYGRGFAVVADEIRSLAESTTKNASNISRTLASLVKKMGEAREVSKETGEAFRDIESGAHSVSEAFSEISTSTRELSIGAREVVSGTEALSQITEEITGSAKEMRIGASEVTEVLTSAREAAGATKQSMESIRTAASQVTEATNNISRLSVETNNRIIDLLRLITAYRVDEESDEKVAMERLSVANIILNHMSWIANYRELLDAGELGEEAIAGVGDPAHCELGQWLQLEGKTIIREPEAYRRLQEKHRELHREAEALLRCDESGGCLEREEGFEGLLSISREITEMLTAHQRDASVRWTEAVAVGVSLFDEHHKRLFATINKLYEAMKSGASRERLKEVFDELLEYTSYHFSSEETVLERLGSPMCEIQAEQHAELIRQAKELREDLEAGRAMVAVEVMEFLRDWVTNHIKGCDKLYRSTLESVDVEKILADG